jgi:hypothetical protein
MNYYKAQFDRYDFKAGVNAIWFKNVTENGVNLGRKYMIAEEIPQLIGNLIYECWIFWETVDDKDYGKLNAPREYFISKDRYFHGTRY